MLTIKSGKKGPQIKKGIILATNKLIRLMFNFFNKFTELLYKLNKLFKIINLILKLKLVKITHN